MRSGLAVVAVVLGVVLAVPGARAQVAHTPNTLKLAKTESSPKARIADVAWLAGRWVGDFMGGKGEEVFAPPQGEAFGRGRSLRDRRPRCSKRGPASSFVVHGVSERLAPVAARGVSQRGGASRCGSEVSERPGERSSPHPGEPRAGAF